MPNPSHASRGTILLAFFALYIVWGSTYLAIRFAIDTIPPFTMAGVRFLIAGTLLYVLLRIRGEPAPSRSHWIGAAVVGALLLGMGNGGVTWAEQRIPSGAAALLVSGTPAWMVLFDWLRPGGHRPGRGVGIGLGFGIGGMLLLIGPGELAGRGGLDILGAAAVLVGSMAWAFGSILSRSLRLPRSVMILTAMQMMVAGVLLSTLGIATGEWNDLNWREVSAGSATAMGYLIVFGSWVGFGAYVYLLRVTTPARASTYAYVNPVVAVLLGWWFAGETLDGRTVAAMVIIVAGVAMITLSRASHASTASSPPPPRTGVRSGGDLASPTPVD